MYKRFDVFFWGQGYPEMYIQEARLLPLASKYS